MSILPCRKFKQGDILPKINSFKFNLQLCELISVKPLGGDV